MDLFNFLFAEAIRSHFKTKKRKHNLKLKNADGAQLKQQRSRTRLNTVSLFEASERILTHEHLVQSVTYILVWFSV